MQCPRPRHARRIRQAPRRNRLTFVCVCAFVTQGNSPASLAAWDPANAVRGNSRKPCCRHRLRMCRAACLLLSRSDYVASRVHMLHLPRAAAGPRAPLFARGATHVRGPPPPSSRAPSRRHRRPEPSLAGLRYDNKHDGCLIATAPWARRSRSRGGTLLALCGPGGGHVLSDSILVCTGKFPRRSGRACGASDAAGRRVACTEGSCLPQACQRAFRASCRDREFCVTNSFMSAQETATRLHARQFWLPLPTRHDQTTAQHGLSLATARCFRCRDAIASTTACAAHTAATITSKLQRSAHAHATAFARHASRGQCAE